jgi:hypothetical protein
MINTINLSPIYKYKNLNLNLETIYDNNGAKNAGACLEPAGYVMLETEAVSESSRRNSQVFPCKEVMPCPIRTVVVVVAIDKLQKNR